MKYDKEEILKMLQDNGYHSPEISETDDENPNAKRNVNIYDLSWRLDEVRLINFLFAILFLLSN